MAALAGSERARMYALSGVARAGATRSGYVSGQVFIKYGGVHYGWNRDTNQGVLIGSLSINQELDETPDTCRFTVNGGVPSIGDEVIVTLGSKNSTMPLFAGYGLTVTQKYVGDRPANVQADITAVDYTWQLGFHLVTAQYRNMGAGQIVQDLIARYAGGDGFTATAVDPELTILDEITFTNEELTAAITRVVRRAGAYWYCDYRRNVHVFVSETLNGAPEPLTPAHTSLAHVTRQTERTQVLTRVYVEGRGSRLLSHVAAGDTMIPLDTVEMFSVASDVFLKASFQGSEGGAQHLNFAGVLPGGAGAIVGPGLNPTTAPTVTPAGGGAINAGGHYYAYTWVTASGETLPSPAFATPFTAGTLPPPTAAPIVQFNGPNSINYGAFRVIGETVRYAVAYSTATAGNDTSQITTIGPYVETVTTQCSDPNNPTRSSVIGLGIKFSADPRVKWIFIYSWASSKGGPFWMTGQVENQPNAAAGTVWGWQDIGGDVTSGFQAPATNTATFNTALLSGIAVGPSAVTARKLYRTAADQFQPLRLIQTIANNTATTATDAAADSALGANAPVADTSGLQQPAGTVPAGATALTVTSPAAFLPGGGWAVIGNGEQVIRYTGVSGNQITGIPASGIGAITATISYNSTVTAAAMLTGIPATGPRSIASRPLTAGDEIYLVVQVDEIPRQGELAADVGGTGLREEWVQDRRLSIEEARARGRATLALRPLDVQTLAYTSRDLRTAVGKFVTANLPAPTNISGDYRILAVQIANFRPHKNQYPTFTVRASSTMFSFDDWLRRMRTEV